MTDADQLREALAIALQERDEAQAALRTVAERQREACAAEASGVACYGHGMDADEVWMREACVDAVLATPLVGSK